MMLLLDFSEKTPQAQDFPDRDGVKPEARSDRSPAGKPQAQPVEEVEASAAGFPGLKKIGRSVKH
jgi:hypothetical protein